MKGKKARPAGTRLVVVDISSFIFRAFYAIRLLHAPDGTPVNAVRGVWSMLLKLIMDWVPTHLFIAQDSKGPSFREKLYDEYKANRSAPPEDLIPQFELIHKLTDLMGIKGHSLENYEADDIIGSVCSQWKNDFDEIYIVSGDKDLMQFIGGNTFMLDTMKDIRYGRQEVFEKMGVWPEQIVDYLSLIGDSSDNIPGMPGIGPKGAAKLLAEFGSLDGCIQNKDKLTGKKIVDAFTNHLDEALLSKKLVEIRCDLNLDFTPQDTAYRFFPAPELKLFLQKLDFKTALEKLSEFDQIEAQDLPQSDDHQFAYEIERRSENQNSAPMQAIVAEKIHSIDTSTIDDLFRKIGVNTQAALLVEYKKNGVYFESIKKIVLTFDGEESYYCTENDLCEKIFCEMTKSSTLQISLLNPKEEFAYAFDRPIIINAKIFDVIQAHFLINADAEQDFISICKKVLDVHLPDQKENSSLLLNDHQQQSDDGLRCRTLYKLSLKMIEDLNIHRVRSVYDEIDGPLIPILSKMEKIGISINQSFFKKLETDFSQELNIIEEEVIKLIKEESKTDVGHVNLKSPKQLGHVLFDVLKLPIIKKTKTGASTDSEVLEELEKQNISQIPRLILKYREIDKILSTYVRTIPHLVDPTDQRVHTTFDQHTAATGRLASFEPNLQNIPIRTENGRLIRKGFVAKPGWLLLSADYSQVELRILAHFANDKTMLEAFQQDKDIHAQTAAEILQKPLDQISQNDRAMAKAVNFGLMYGQSSFGLANTLKISRNEARDYITMYFERFAQVKSYLDSLRDYCETHGHTKTLFGRKRFLPDIRSQNRTVKSMAERMAINTPIQGTAADIVKVAMIHIDQMITDKGLKSRLCLQVHDELIFEVPEEELTLMQDLVRQGMENAAQLKAPLKVDMGIGVNWYNLK